jgi:hypothetical protein
MFWCKRTILREHKMSGLKPAASYWQSLAAGTVILQTHIFFIKKIKQHKNKDYVHVSKTKTPECN